MSTGAIVRHIPVHLHYIDVQERVGLHLPEGASALFGRRCPDLKRGLELKHEPLSKIIIPDLLICPMCP